ncbi:MAG: hypothetical protein AABY01_00860, partial [Nanoarchaeota archaeon]
QQSHNNDVFCEGVLINSFELEKRMMMLGNEQVETIFGKAFELANSRQIALTAKSIKLGNKSLFALLDQTIEDVRVLKSAAVSGKMFTPEDAEAKLLFSILSVPMRADFGQAILEHNQEKQARILLHARDILVMKRLQPLMNAISNLAELKVEFFGY